MSRILVSINEIDPANEFQITKKGIFIGIYKKILFLYI